MISPSFIAFAVKTWEMYYDVIKYATFSDTLWLAIFKTCTFHSILQQNLTFSLLTWLGSPIFFFYLLVRTTNFLWVVFNKIWIIRFFAVVNYMVRKFSFCSNFMKMSSQTLSFYTFFMPPAWKVRQGHLVNRLSVCPSVIPSRLHTCTKCNI